MLKVATLLGTRPEVIKLSVVIEELDRVADQVVIHTGQNFDYELDRVFFDDLGIRQPDYFLNSAGDTAATTIANVIRETDVVLGKESPDAFLLLGDTNSCLAVISAKRRAIPVFHMEAGNRSFDDRVPEEINRRIVDHISDINLVYTEHARRYLLAEGIRPETIIKTGSPMREVIERHSAAVEASDILDRLNLSGHRFLVASAHRQENVDDERRLRSLMEAFRKLAHDHDAVVLFSTHPRTRSRLDELGISQVDGVRFSKPLGFFDYVKLQSSAMCVLSDSGTITEEASILGFPAVTIRESHERPEGMDEGTVVMSGLRADRITEAVEVAMRHHSEGWRPEPVEDYSARHVSKKVARIILSYTEYVRRTVWGIDAFGSPSP